MNFDLGMKKDGGLAVGGSKRRISEIIAEGSESEPLRTGRRRAVNS